MSDLGGASWLAEERLSAWHRFEESSLPAETLEEWRYSRIDQLELDRYAPLAGATGEVLAIPDLSADAAALLAGLGNPAALVLARNGVAVSVSGTCEGLEVIDLAASAEDLRAEVGEAAEPDALAILNRALSARPQLLRISGDLGARPVVVVNWLDAEGAAVFPRLNVEVGRSARATVVEVVASTDVASLIVPVTQLSLGPGSELGYLNLQILGPLVWQTALQVSEVGRDARLTSAAVALGGEYARLRTDSALVGQGASSKLLAVYFGAGAQMHDFRTLQAHKAPHTTSDLLYKGAVANRARSVYSGLIRVEKGARASNAFQTNRNLVLHEGAHADSVPNLEIEDNDVRCSHASAVGPIDEDQRFYLESRGVPTQVADRLITFGFLDEALAGIPVPGIRDAVRKQLAAKLADAEAQEERW